MPFTFSSPTVNGDNAVLLPNDVPREATDC